MFFLSSFGFFAVGADNSHEEWQDLNPILARPIESLNWSARAKNALSDEEIDYLGALVKRTEKDLLLRVPNLGMKSISKIREWLAPRGLYLGMDINWPSDREQESKLVEKLKAQKKREERILTLITENSQITIPELSNKIGVSKYQVGLIIARLIMRSHLIRISHYDYKKERIKKVVSLVKKDPQITILKLASELGVSTRTVSTMIVQLKKKVSLLGGMGKNTDIGKFCKSNHHLIMILKRR